MFLRCFLLLSVENLLIRGLGSEGDGITGVDEGLGGFVVFGAFEAV